MSRAHYFQAVQDRYGNAQAGVIVHVYEPGTTTHIAQSMYAAASGGSPIANPLTTDANGQFAFFLDAAQNVDLNVVNGSVSQTTPSVAVGDVGSPKAMRADFVVDPDGRGTHLDLQSAVDDVPEGSPQFATVIALLPSSAQDAVVVSGVGKQIAFVASGYGGIDGFASINGITYEGEDSYCFLHGIKLTAPLILPDGYCCFAAFSSELGNGMQGTDDTDVELHSVSSLITRITVGSIHPGSEVRGGTLGILHCTGDIGRSVFDTQWASGGGTIPGFVADTWGDSANVICLGSFHNVIMRGWFSANRFAYLKCAQASKGLQLSELHALFDLSIFVQEDGGAATPDRVTVMGCTADPTSTIAKGAFTNSVFGPNTPDGMDLSGVTGAGNMKPTMEPV